MNTLDKLASIDTWLQYYDYRANKNIFKKGDLEALRSFIDSGEYLTKAREIAHGGYPLGLPNKKIINKIGTNKKRVVYSFASDETYILKVLSYLMYEYDGIFTDNLYSFRKDKGVKNAIGWAIKHRDCYALKVDISNYFNSIPVDRLLSKLRGVIHDDKLNNFFKKLLTENKSVLNGKVVVENRGAMAGMPLSPFFANVYLSDLDRVFMDKMVPYARYSDDIIIFADSIEDLEGYKNMLFQYIVDMGLSINPDKVQVYSPIEPWDFLGFSCINGRVDLSPIALKKMKGKIRRKCRALYRWRLKKGVDSDRAIKVAIRVFNKKFYTETDANELSYSRWYFPQLTDDSSLRVIDEYLLNHLRYISSGRFTKKNYQHCDYEHLKKLGYRSLVREYWKYKKQPSK